MHDRGSRESSSSDSGPQWRTEQPEDVPGLESSSGSDGQDGSDSSDDGGKFVRTMHVEKNVVTLENDAELLASEPTALLEEQAVLDQKINIQSHDDVDEATTRQENKQITGIMLGPAMIVAVIVLVVWVNIAMRHGN